MAIKQFTKLSIKSINILSSTKTKTMSRKTKNNRNLTIRLRSTPVLVGLSVIALALVFGLTPILRLASYQSQINALNQQNSGDQNIVNGLQVQANSYQSEVNNLQSQITDIQNAIGANQAKQASIKADILSNQQKLAKQKSNLADDIQTMYVSGQLTPVEMLATSSSLSQYVDQQVAYNAVENKIQSTVDTINGLQKELKDQETQVEALLQTEQTQNSTLVSDQNQVNSLLSYNQQQQASYTQQIKANTSQISKLQAEQAAAYAAIAKRVNVSGASASASGGSGGLCDIGQGNGGYPMQWCNAPQDSLVDNYGFPNRECTSFANWYFTSVEHQSGFTVSGNAGWWYLTSNYPAITWSGGVKPGALGIEPSSSLNAPVPSLHGGWYGHVMVVIGMPGTTYNGSFPYTSAAAGTVVPQGDVLVASMNEDFNGHFLYNLWPINYLMYINPQ